MRITKKFINTIHREFTRVACLIAVGLIFVAYSPALAIWLNIPAISPWGLFLGGAFFVAALSHVMRRALFPGLDLQTIANNAVQTQNVAAGMIFLGVCVVLAAFIFMNGSMLRL